MPSERETIDSVRAKNTRCDSCEDPSPTWNVQDSVNMLPEIIDGEVNTSIGIPVRAVMCGTCGYLRLYAES